MTVRQAGLDGETGAVALPPRRLSGASVTTHTTGRIREKTNGNSFDPVREGADVVLVIVVSPASLPSGTPLDKRTWDPALYCHFLCDHGQVNHSDQNFEYMKNVNFFLGNRPIFLSDSQKESETTDFQGVWMAY